MNRTSMKSFSSALIAVIISATAALSGCASVSDESFQDASNSTMPIDREGSA